MVTIQLFFYASPSPRPPPPKRERGSPAGVADFGQKGSRGKHSRDSALSGLETSQLRAYARSENTHDPSAAR